MSYLFKDFDKAYLFAYGMDMSQTVKRMRNFCKASNISVAGVFGTDSYDMTKIKQAFKALIESIMENGVQYFVVVKSVDSILIGFKEMDFTSNLVDRGAIAVWCLDEHTLLVNPEKAAL